MADIRMARIWDLITAQAVSRNAPASAVDVCVAAVAALGVSGAVLTAVGRLGAGHVLCVTDEISEQIAELQLTVGEGPAPDAHASGGPVLVADLAATKMAARWPVFASMALQIGAVAVFAFPLQIGAIRVGVLELYRSLPGLLTTQEFGDALVFADTATLLLLGSQDGNAGPDRDPVTGIRGLGPCSAGPPTEMADHRAEIDQATGMLTEQLGVGIDEAFIRLRGYAYAQDRRLLDVSRDIVARRLRLSPDDYEGGMR
jgi:hypothetical protein